MSNEQPGAQPNPYGQPDPREHQRQPPPQAFPEGQPPAYGQQSQNAYGQASPQGQPTYGAPQRAPYGSSAPQGHGQTSAYGQAPQGAAFGQPGAYGQAPQQPNPYGQPGYGAPGGPGQPNYGQPYGAPQPPKKKGLPWWGWGLIVVGGIIVIGGGIYGAMALTHAVQHTIASDDDSADPDPAPAPETDEPASDDGEDPLGTDPSLPAEAGAYTLDDVAPFSDKPYWSVPLVDGWDTLMFDEGGMNVFQDPSGTGCVFSSYQGVWLQGDASATTDADATAADFDYFIESNTAQVGATGVEITERSSVEVASTEGYVEFAAYDVSYEPDAEISDAPSLDERWYIRSMIDVNSTMFVRLSCDSRGFDESIVADTIDASTIAE